MDWQSGQCGIDGLRDIVQQNSRAAAREVDLVREATARVNVVQDLLLARPPHHGRPLGYQPASGVDVPCDTTAADAGTAAPASSGPPVAGDKPASDRRPAGVARLREGPLADLFRATDARPGQA